MQSLCTELALGIEAWAMKVENVRTLEWLKRIMGRWMCGVSLKDRKRSVDFNSFLGVHAECGKCGEAKQIDVVWPFEHLRREIVDD